MLNPIYVPTKGRAGTSQTIKNLIEQKIPFTIFVEPGEVEAYTKAYGTGGFMVAILKGDNLGLVHSRNEILEHARAVGNEWIWMLDDDITSMGVVKDSKVVKTPWAEVLEKAQQAQVKFPNLALMGLEYQQFAWSATKEYSFNSYADTCVALDVRKLKGFKYRTEFKHDRDMVLQLLTMGYLTLRTSMLAFGSPRNGSNKGGLYDLYKAGKEEAASKEMVKLWPGVCTFNVKKDGRPDVKVNWRLFKKASPEN